MKGKAGSGKVTKPTQPKALEDNYHKGSKQKGKQVGFVEDVEDDSEDEQEPVCIGLLSTQKIRELPHVNVPPLTLVVQADRQRPIAVEGPAYTTCAPIEKEGLGQEILKEILSALFDVTIGQLLGSAPGVRKELLEQLAKVRRAPEEEPKHSQYKATVEDIMEEEEISDS